jgi:acyl-CoA hydrolase
MSFYQSIAALHDWVRQLKPGDEVYVAGCNGESQTLLDALNELKPCCQGVRFTGVQIPGANTFSYADLSEHTEQTTFFLSDVLQSAYRQGRVHFLPLTYICIWHYLTRKRFDWVVFQGAPVNGGVSLSVASDFTTAVVKHAKRVLALENPLLPPSNCVIADSDIDQRIEAPASLVHYDPGKTNPAMMVLGKIIADQVPNGATLQFGLGKIQTAVLRNLRHHRELRVHSGMVSDAVLELLESNALARMDPRSPPITTGVALGSDVLYQQITDPALTQFQPVSYTHSAQTLAALTPFVSINSIIEVDLSGQVNGEWLGGKQISGGGGMADFVLGAKLGWQSTSILATPASAAGGTVSRIKAQLEPGTPVTVPRHDVDVIATEFGIARLKHLNTDQRAEALIAIADPQFRDQLARDYAALRAKR